MNVPPLLVLTDRTQIGDRTLVDVVASAIDGGARAVVLREKDLPREERAQVAGTLRAQLIDVGGVLLMASDTTIESDGVHLAATDRWPSPRPAVVGRSCHNTAEVEVARREGCDYVTLSPVFASPSKSGYGPALGLAALRSPRVATYALGGITQANARACIEAGAAGVAVMGAIMRAKRPDHAVRRLLDVLEVVA